jgi:hypothetical protein
MGINYEQEDVVGTGRDIFCMVYGDKAEPQITQPIQSVP